MSCMQGMSSAQMSKESMSCMQDTSFARSCGRRCLMPWCRSSWSVPRTTRPTLWKASATAAMTLSGEPPLYQQAVVGAAIVSPDVDMHAVCIDATSAAAVCIVLSPEFAFALPVHSHSFTVSAASSAAASHPAALVVRVVSSTGLLKHS